MTESKAQSGFLKAVEDGKNNYLLESLSILTMDPVADRSTISSKLDNMRKYVSTSSDPSLQARFGVYADKIQNYGTQNQPARTAKPGSSVGSL